MSEPSGVCAPDDASYLNVVSTPVPANTPVTVVLRTGSVEMLSNGVAVLVHRRGAVRTVPVRVHLNNLVACLHEHAARELEADQAPCCIEGDSSTPFCGQCGRPRRAHEVTTSMVRTLVHRLVHGMAGNLGGLWDVFFAHGWELAPVPVTDGVTVCIPTRAGWTLAALLDLPDFAPPYVGWTPEIVLVSSGASAVEEGETS